MIAIDDGGGPLLANGFLQGEPDDFLAARDETLALLSPLPSEIWQRQGQHTFFGPTSLHEIVYLAVQHDRLHARQIDELTMGE